MMGINNISESPKDPDADKRHNFKDNNDNKTAIATFFKQFDHVPPGCAHILGVGINPPINFLHQYKCTLRMASCS